MADSEDANIPTTSGRDAPEGYKVLTEGKGSILQKGNDVFYNPAQARPLLLQLAEHMHHCLLTSATILTWLASGGQPGYFHSSTEILCPAAAA